MSNVSEIYLFFYYYYYRNCVRISKLEMVSPKKMDKYLKFDGRQYGFFFFFLSD